MALRLVQVNFKARDDSALGRFWAEALGWGVSSEGPGVTNVEPVGFAWPDPAAVCVDVVAVPDPETVKYRVHLDLATTSAAHQAELVARLKELGATPADVGQGDVPWTVLADPEGNVFCVLEPREIYRDTGPIAAVVVDCADPRAMARFWGEAMDWTLHEVTDDHAVLRSAKGVGPYLEFLRTPGVKTVWNRVHLDLLPYPGDDQAAEVARLRALGATDADVGQGDVRGRAWPTRRATSSASSARPDATPPRRCLVMVSRRIVGLRRPGPLPTWQRSSRRRWTSSSRRCSVGSPGRPTRPSQLSRQARERRQGRAVGRAGHRGRARDPGVRRPRSAASRRTPTRPQQSVSRPLHKPWNGREMVSASRVSRTASVRPSRTGTPPERQRKITGRRGTASRSSVPQALVAIQMVRDTSEPWETPLPATRAKRRLAC